MWREAIGRYRRPWEEEDVEDVKPRRHKKMGLRRFVDRD